MRAPGEPLGAVGGSSGAKMGADNYERAHLAEKELEGAEGAGEGADELPERGGRVLLRAAAELPP